MKDNLLDETPQEAIRTSGIQLLEVFIFITGGYYLLTNAWALKQYYNTEEFGVILSSIAIIMGVLPVTTYTWMWRQTSMKYEERESDMGGGLITLLYFISYPVIISCFVISVFHFIGIWRDLSGGLAVVDPWRVALLKLVQSLGMGILYAAYLYETRLTNK